MPRVYFQNQKGRRGAGPLNAGDCFAGSVFGGDRSTPAKAIVHADLDGVLVVAEAGPDDFSRASGEGGVAEIVVLILGLRRPIRGEHVFKAGANGPAVLLIAGRRESDRSTGDRNPD